jgi:uncharacterized protein DUF3455
MQNSKEIIMNHLIIKLFVFIALFAFAVQPAFAQNGPELPEQCGLIAAPEGQQLAFHVYAKGVQVYTWNSVTFAWDFAGPRAALFAEESYHGEVGDHFPGPNWQSKSGSRVKAAAIPGKLCQPDATAIPWLLLKSTENTAGGIFRSVTYVLRVNTTGGLKPTDPGNIGEVREVEYTAEYYFYREQ